MTLQETIDQLIEYIDVATAVASVTNHQVATVLDFLNESLKTSSSSLANLDSRYLRKDIADSAGAAESFPHGISVSQILGLGDNPSFSGTSSKAVNDGEGNNISETYAKKSDFFDFGNVGFGYLINAVIGKTAYLADDEASGGAVMIIFMDTEQEYSDTLLFTDLETDDLLWNLLAALESSDQWDYIQEKYGILEYGVLDDSSDVHDGQLYFRSNNPNFDIDSSLPSDLASIDGQEFSVDGTESHWIEKRRKTNVLYIDLNQNKIYTYSVSDDVFGNYVALSDGSSGTSDYNNLDNKPKINNVVLEGNKTLAQLGLSTVARSGSYNDLTDKPTIPTQVTSSTVSSWGFTKNAVTVVKMNGSIYDPVGGTVNLGTVITEHQPLTAYRMASAQDTIDASKANKAPNPTTGHIASLDGSGNPVDSGKSADDLTNFVKGYYHQKSQTINISQLGSTNTWTMSFNGSVVSSGNNVPGSETLDKIVSDLALAGYNAEVAERMQPYKIVIHGVSGITVNVVSTSVIGVTTSWDSLDGFFTTDSFETRLPNSSERLYEDLTTLKLYEWTGTGYREVSRSEGGGSGLSDFNALSNRPKYAGQVMTGNTDIPAFPSGFYFSAAGSSTALGSTYHKLYLDDDYELAPACAYGVTNNVENSQNLVTSAAVYAAIGNIETLLTEL